MAMIRNLTDQDRSELGLTRKSKRDEAIGPEDDQPHSRYSLLFYTIIADSYKLLPILLSQASAKNESRTFEDDSKESEDDRPLSRYSPYSKFLPNLTYYYKILRFQPSATSNQA